jgi:hypothetical protein
MVAEMTDEKITPSDLRAHAEVLIALGKMPTLAELHAAIASTKQKFRPLIEAARREDDADNSKA